MRHHTSALNRPTHLPIKMANMRMILAVSLAVLFFAQLAMCVPEGDRWTRSAESKESEEDPGKALKKVEAKVTVAVEDLRKGITTMFENLSSAIQTEMAKHPEANQMYNNLYNNVTSGVSDLIKSLKDAGATTAPATA